MAKAERHQFRDIDDLYYVAFARQQSRRRNDDINSQAAYRERSPGCS